MDPDLALKLLGDPDKKIQAKMVQVILISIIFIGSNYM